MPVTIKDVAALAGVSPSTVSRTCKDNPSISKETKEKVRRAMAELGYEPNFQASNLASNNSRTIGIILPVSDREVFENTFYLEVIRGISQFCNQRQYASTIITGHDEEEMMQMIRTMARRGQADGFILLYSKHNDPIIDFLDDEGILYVLIGKAYQSANQTVYVDNDNIQAGQEATEYLYRLGHRKIAYLGRDERLLVSTDRKYGYQLCTSRHRLKLPNEYALEIPSVLSEEADNALTKLLMSENCPTAMVVCDDIQAIALMRICRKLGIAIPEDLSVISFNNSMYAKLAEPQLTSMDINTIQLGIEAASQVINHIENPNLFATKIIVPHFIVERESCKRL